MSALQYSQSRCFVASLLLIATTGCLLAQSALTVSCDQPTGVYPSGQEAVFTITRNDAAETSPAATVKILRNNREVLVTKTVPGNKASQAIRFTPPTDGWYLCTVTLPGEEKKPAAATGVVFNPDALAPSMPAPDDFDAFWAAQKARLAAQKPAPVLAPLTPEQRLVETANPDHLAKIESLEKQGFTCSNLSIPCLDVRPLEGYFAKPPPAANGGRPAILFFHAAGIEGGWCRATAVNALIYAQRFNAIVLDMNAHGMLNGQPQSYYDALAKEGLSGYQSRGLESREQYYFLGMFLRLLRGIDFLCAQPEWDGKHLICIGISQGGAQVLAAAGLDSRVSAAVAIVPGMCDITGPVADKPSGWPGFGGGKLDDGKTKQSLETVRYFDAVNFCARSKAETLMTVGFADTTCSPPGVFTAFNQLKTKKRIITVPDKGHHALSSPTKELSEQYNAFVLAHTKDE